MAPNLKHRSSNLRTIDLDLVQPVKAGFPPLISEVPQKSPDSPQQDNSNYWEWSAENDADIKKIVDEESLSADHFVASIIGQPAAKTCALLADIDQYWYWSHSQQEGDDYWNWIATNDDQRKRVPFPPASVQKMDSYWA